MGGGDIAHRATSTAIGIGWIFKKKHVGEVGHLCSSSASIPKCQAAGGVDGVLAPPFMVLTSSDLGKVKGEDDNISGFGESNNLASNF